MSSNDMPTRREIFAEHLYAKVEELSPKFSPAKVTGMLVDGGETNVIRMLQDPSYLQLSVERAILSLEKQNYIKSDADESKIQVDVSSTVKNLDLCERLYDEVAVLEPELASQITGMLLELDEETVSCLLSNDSRLQGAVTKAKQSYLSNMEPSECNNNNSTNSDATELGDLLFEKVMEVFPQHAAEITGMLLEMEKTSLDQLLSQPKDLQTCIHRAHQALKGDNN